MKTYQTSRFKNVCVAAALGVLSCVHHSAYACAVLTEDFRPVRVADESALIIWNSTTHTQHFIRRATFDTDAKSIGFLVPTPALPQLGEAEDAIFDQLEEKIRPRVIHQNVKDYYPASLLSVLFSYGSATEETASAGNSATATTSLSRSVEVVSQQRVAGFDTAILRANDVDALQNWLKKNGYVSGPMFNEWLQPYLQKSWYITAFKYAKTASTQHISSDAVRMTFKTDKPFFPYREPQGQGSSKPNEQAHQRLLRVFLLAPGRMDGQLSDGETSGQWEHKVPFARHFDYDELTRIQWDAPKTAQLIQPGWLTVFEDRASVRSNAGDLFWEFSKQQNEAEPPPIIKKHYVPTPISVEPFLLFFAGIGWLWWRRRTT